MSNNKIENVKIFPFEKNGQEKSSESKIKLKKLGAKILILSTVLGAGGIAFNHFSAENQKPTKLYDIDLEKYTVTTPGATIEFSPETMEITVPAGGGMDNLVQNIDSNIPILSLNRSDIDAAEAYIAARNHQSVNSVVQTGKEYEVPVSSEVHINKDK